MKIIYSNISGGFIFAGQKYGELLFSKVSLDSYIQYFKSRDIDILSLGEVHLETKTGSQMVERLSRELGLQYHSSLALSKSFLDSDKDIGMAVLSRYPIIKQEEFRLPSPKLEVDRPDGEHWVMLDKGGQRVYLDINGTTIALANFSYFPFHHFNRRVDEPDFKGLRQELLDVLLANSQGAPSIITGDFNNKGVPIDEAFPELFENGALEQAVTVKSTVIGYDDQLDHILHQPKFFTVKGQFSEFNGSDHLVIGVELDLK